MKNVLLISLIFWSFQSFGSDVSQCHHAISKHLAAAIKHNTAMIPVYAKLTNNASKKVSYSLITMEKIISLVAKPIQKEAWPFQQMGVPLLCEELVDMSLAPGFKNLTQKETRPQSIFPLNMENISKELKKYFEKDQFEEAYSFLEKTLNDLDEEPNQMCLSRHFLESVARTLSLIPAQRELAQQLGLKDPVGILKKYLNNQRTLLTLSHRLDLQAFPLQKAGVPILCADVPAIPWKK